MASRTDPRRLVALVVLLVVLAIVAMVRLRPALTTGGTTTAAVGRVSSYRVPLVEEPLAGSAGAETTARRNLFTFGSPPTPTPDRRPTATPAATFPPRPKLVLNTANSTNSAVNSKAIWAAPRPCAKTRMK